VAAAGRWRTTVHVRPLAVSAMAFGLAQSQIFRAMWQNKVSAAVDSLFAVRVWPRPIELHVAQAAFALDAPCLSLRTS